MLIYAVHGVPGTRDTAKRNEPKQNEHGVTQPEGFICLHLKQLLLLRMIVPLSLRGDRRLGPVILIRSVEERMKPCR